MLKYEKDENQVYSQEWSFQIPSTIKKLQRGLSKNVIVGQFIEPPLELERLKQMNNMRDLTTRKDTNVSAGSLDRVCVLSTNLHGKFDAESNIPG
eukprot:snap_masked-scaffold_3-processed-gene-8.9-mRNA-1 protein AED:1.00 eAED:1.00 QI:0/0/0/0/1/1/2/0/94